MDARVLDRDRARNLVATPAYPPSDPDTPFHEEYSWSELNSGMAANSPDLGIRSK
ncbi:hypothetical protein IWQ61_000691 [Dispira simplex]|nr:hypothetical protein IWQ61_000691 [Dispira simplex]